MQLCQICLAILEKSAKHTTQYGEVPSHAVYTHSLEGHQTTSALQISAQSGCAFCTPFWESLAERHREMLSSPGRGECTVWLFWDEQAATYTQLLYFLGPEFELGENEVTDTFELLGTSEGTVYAQSLPTRLLTLVAVAIRHSQNLKALVTNWVQKCTETHNTASCADNTASWLLTRLIDIGVGSDSREARLITTEGLCPVDHPYVTLSHMAKDQFEGLLRANIDDWMKSLPIKDMPEHFNAATLVADKLGFRYIWIDDICINQDCEADQRNEVSKRGQVFQHCSMNMTADTAESFLRILDPKYGHGSQPAGGDTTTLPTAIVPANIWSAEMVCSPIGRDASFFQDQLFAPRRLHFGKTEIYWQCPELKACETFPEGLPAQLLQNPANDTMIEKISRQAQMPSKSTPTNMRPQSRCNIRLSWRVAWHQIINQYSQCTSTSPSNRLSHVAGIAREFEVLSGDKYIVGLWQGSLINDLLWYTDGKARQRSNNYLTPSWSWTSIESVIKYLLPASLYGNFVKILDVEAGTSIHSSTENTSQGTIKLDGYLLKVLPGPFSADSIFSDCQDDITEGHHFLLPLRLQKTIQGNCLCGLVLRRTEESFTSTYERIGMFRFAEDDSIHIFGHNAYGTAYVFPSDPGNVLDTEYLYKDITII
jgi:hypothetical protein